MNYKGTIKRNNVFKLTNIELKQINKDLKELYLLDFKYLDNLRDNLYNYCQGRDYLNLLSTIVWNVDRYCWNDYINHY